MVTDAIGYFVNVFIPTGQTKSLWLIEKSNWSGVGLKFPRDDFNNIKGRGELSRPGVYILWGSGESDDPNSPQVYIGEADSLSDRLSTHITTDDQSFWQQTIVFTSKDVNLNKAHALFIESRLIKTAQQAKRCVLTNKQSPSEPNLADRESSYALEFLEALRLCLPIAGVHFFDELPQDARQGRPQTASVLADGPTLEPTKLHLSGAASGPTSTVRAEGYINGAEFVVLAGARAAKEEAHSVPSYIQSHRARLVREKHFVERQDCLELTNTIPFNSPSAASGALLGRSSNGRDEWKTSDGRSINDLAKDMTQNQ